MAGLGLLPAAAPGIGVPPAALAALSAAVLLLLLLHRRANLGLPAALAFLAASGAYGFLRSATIRALSEARLGGVPYSLSSPLLTLGGVPLQELLGWTVAAGLASYGADRWLRRCGQPADAYSTALAAGLGMAAVCLAVECAAVTGGWWAWSLAHDPRALLPFPTIGLIDWGFVALDFLLPFELWRRRAPLGQRLASLLFFPIHMAGHAFTAKLPGPLPLSAFDLVHVGLIAAAAAAAAAARDRSPWPAPDQERERFLALAAALVLLLTTSGQLLLAGRPDLLWSGLPLLLLALGAASGRRLPAERTARLGTRYAALLFAALLVLGLGLRVPQARRARDFKALLVAAAEELAGGRAAAARPRLDAALALKPDHSEALWLLAWAELQQGELASARRHAERSLEQRPDSLEAARILTAIRQRESR